MSRLSAKKGSVPEKIEITEATAIDNRYNMYSIEADHSNPFNIIPLNQYRAENVFSLIENDMAKSKHYDEAYFINIFSLLLHKSDRNQIKMTKFKDGKEPEGKFIASNLSDYYSFFIAEEIKYLQKNYNYILSLDYSVASNLLPPLIVSDNPCLVFKTSINKEEFDFLYLPVKERKMSLAFRTISDVESFRNLFESSDIMVKYLINLVNDASHLKSDSFSYSSIEGIKLFKQINELDLQHPIEYLRKFTTVEDMSFTVRDYPVMTLEINMDDAIKIELT